MSSSAGGQPRTVDVPLTAPSQTVSYTLPPGVTFDVEAVYVEVDTSGAGGVVSAELTVSEQSGVVIAKKTQGATIPAGTTGSATWALRLTDEAATTPGGSGIQFDTYPQAGTFLYEEATGYLDAATQAALDARYPAAPARTFLDAEILALASGGGDVTLYSPAGGKCNLYADSNGSVNLLADPGGFGVINMESWEWFADAFQIRITGGNNGVTVQASGTGDLLLQTDPGGNVLMRSLPIVDPGVSGALWNNGGFVAISP